MSNFLSKYPSTEALLEFMVNNEVPVFRNANGHLHTPYSFSSFSDIGELFDRAVKEDISVVGINDFFVTDGYKAFCELSLKHGRFPLFNIEFIGLIKEAQKKGDRINDPNNPGRIYFSGKGLDYPFHLDWSSSRKLKRVVRESQLQVKGMVKKADRLVKNIRPSLNLRYVDIKKRFAFELVRERHIAKAIRVLAEENYTVEPERLEFFKNLYGGKESKTGITNTPALETEIRSNLLKAGGLAFIEEDERSFLGIDQIIRIILKAGGIPCYPVLLDDSKGQFTEYEKDWDYLFHFLESLGVKCIELIPLRNDFHILKKFVQFFAGKGFLILFGTEHNTPEMIPLTVSARGGIELDKELKQIAWDSICVIAAHQYYRSLDETGFMNPDGSARLSEKDRFISIGRAVIEYYLKTTKNAI